MITLDSAQVIIILAAAGAALAAVCLCLLVMLLVRNKGNDSGGDLPGLMADEFERSRRELSASLADMNRRIDETNRRSHDVQSNLIKTVGDALDAIRVSDLEQNERLMRALMTSMDKMRESNEQKLEQMRLTVDEKLDSTLTQRLNTSFRAVSEGLESVNRSLGEMKELSAGVTDNVTALNRVLTNVKSRGTWAEIQLENILDETIPGMYVKNFSPDGSQSRVEFAVKLPRAETGEITYLPLDSKFPMEDYVRLCNAREQGDAQAAAAAAKQLLVAIVNEAKRIRKYISPPVTTPYAVMYLATEGLFAEVTSSSDAIAERIKTAPQRSPHCFPLFPWATRRSQSTKRQMRSGSS